MQLLVLAAKLLSDLLQLHTLGQSHEPLLDQGGLRSFDLRLQPSDNFLSPRLGLQQYLVLRLEL